MELGAQGFRGEFEGIKYSRQDLFAAPVFHQIQTTLVLDTGLSLYNIEAEIPFHLCQFKRCGRQTIEATVEGFGIVISGLMVTVFFNIHVHHLHPIG